MRIKLTLRRKDGSHQDLLVTADAAATVADVARELVEADPATAHHVEGGELTLTVAQPEGRPVILNANRAMSEAAIASGYVVEVVPASAADGAGSADAATLRVVGGPDAGRSFGLAAGSAVVGRDESADITLNDSFVSKHHARIDVADAISVIDLNSANGIVVDGTTVSRVTLVPGQHVIVGDSVLEITALAPPGGSGSEAPTGAAIPFNRSPRVEPRYPSTEHPRPKVPAEPDPPMFSPIMLIGPIIMGLAMFLFNGRPLSLMMAGMAPIMLSANYFQKNKQNRHREQTEIGKFEAQVEMLEEIFESELPLEIAVRQAEVPPVSEIYQSALDRAPGLWTRRPEHWSFLTLRLGEGQLLSRNTIAAAGDQDNGMPMYTRELRMLEEKYRMVRDVPVLEAGLSAGSIGLVGGAAGADALRGILVQLAGLHSPAELVMTAFTSPGELAELDWMRWLPHTSSPQSPIDGMHLVDTQTTSAQVLGELEYVVKQRLGTKAEAAAQPLGPLQDKLVATALGGQLGEAGTHVEGVPIPAIVVVVTEHAPVDRARLVQLAERGHEVGVMVINLASSVTELLPACRTFVDVSAGLDSATANFVRHGVVVPHVRVEGVGIEHAHRFALSLSPLVDSGAIVDDSSDLPRHVSMVSLLGAELVEASAAVVERWRQNDSIHDRHGPLKPRRRSGSLRALVGQAGVDAMHLDLRVQGPHALVGGTTGAGKSEFLQAWVLGMAAEYSPDRVTFLFVDYKGGAAFAECTKLPHCVGLVTDLSQHLVRRALTSLRAELHYRERLLNKKKAKDLLELEKRGDPEAPPALILVIDEFAALSKEVPTFVDGVVDIAQRGRSLGIHLIMATQRPAGVIKDNLRANTNLRIALRMADESDSQDVIETPEAAHISPSIPGRGVAKAGPGRLTPFQSAYAGGHTTNEPDPVSIEIQELRFGSDVRWQRPQLEIEPQHQDPGPTDLVRLVGSISRASSLAEIPIPRKPWLDELSEAYDLAFLKPRTDSALVIGVADIPEEQKQEIVYFRPDVDGNLSVYGTSGSGKSVLLRTLAISAGVTPRGGPVFVYCLDFAAGGLRILEPLPHVGAVIAGDDTERVARLFRELSALLEQRARDYNDVNAGSIEEYRALADKPDEPRILILLDDIEKFRDSYEFGVAKGAWFAVFEQLLSEGRALGMHVVFTADRGAAVTGGISASVPRRVVLRLVDEQAYLQLGAAKDVLGPDSTPGRAIVDGLETQVAILGGSGNVSDQAAAIRKLSKTIERQGRAPAPPVRVLPSEIFLKDLPSQVGGKPVLGLSDVTLEPVGFEPSGTFILGGAPGSGKTNGLLVLSQSLRRWNPDIALAYFGGRRSSLPDELDWDLVATTPGDIADLAKQITAKLEAGDAMRHTAVILEGVSELVQTPAEAPLVNLIKLMRNSEHLIIGESDTTTWLSVMPLYGQFRSARRGFLLQPEWSEGEAIMKVPFPRVKRAEYPLGRGMYASGGRVTKVQLPLATWGSLPIVDELDAP